MSATIVRNRIRIKVDNILSRGSLLTDVLTGTTAQFWQSEDVQVELGIYSAGVIAADLSNCASVTFLVKDKANLSGSALLSQTILAASMDLTVSDADWVSGAAQHAVFVFTAAETNVALTGAAAKTLTWFFYMTTTDAPARRIPLGKGDALLSDSGYGDLGAQTVLAPGARMKDSKLQVQCVDDSLYYDLRVRKVAGTLVPSVEGSGEA